MASWVSLAWLNVRILAKEYIKSQKYRPTSKHALHLNVYTHAPGQ